MNRALLAAVSLLAVASLSTPKADAATMLSGVFDGGQNFAPNWVNGTVGALITVGATDLEVTSLGFNDYQQNGFSNPAGHQVGIWSTDAGNPLLGSVTLPTGASGTLIQEWRFAALGTPVKLSANTQYFIGASTTTDDGDLWFGSNGPEVTTNFTFSSDFTGTPALFNRNDGTFGPPLDGTGVIGYTVNMEYKALTPPTMTLAKNHVQGLQIVAGSVSYDRQNIRTLSANETWVGQPGTVTYAMTIGSFPPPVYPIFQTHMMLIPNAGNENAPDYFEENAMTLDVMTFANGQAQGNLRFKTNQPGSNLMFFTPTGNPTNVIAASPIGTWSLSFSQDTNITISGPGGVVAMATLTTDQAALFASGVIFYVGNIPNNAANGSQSCTLTSVDITGAAAPDIHDTFGTFDETRWDKSTAVSAAAITLIGTNDIFLSWTIPDTGFGELQTSSNLTSWAGSSLITNAARVGDTKRIVLKTTALPNPSNLNFRLVKRIATQLQVLLPGETAAPNTPSGKTGGPIEQTNGISFNIIINACDQNWEVVNSVGDTVHLEASGGFPVFPADFNLLNGTSTQEVTFNDAGLFTITASDVTDPAKASSTNAAVTVNP